MNLILFKEKLAELTEKIVRKTPPFDSPEYHFYDNFDEFVTKFKESEKNQLFEQFLIWKKRKASQLEIFERPISPKLKETLDEYYSRLESKRVYPEKPILKKKVIVKKIVGEFFPDYIFDRDYSDDQDSFFFKNYRKTVELFLKIHTYIDGSMVYPDIGFYYKGQERGNIRFDTIAFNFYRITQVMLLTRPLTEENFRKNLDMSLTLTKTIYPHFLECIESALDDDEKD